MSLKAKLIVALLLVALLSTTIGLTLAIYSTKVSFSTYLDSYASNNLAQWQQAISMYYVEHKSLEGLQHYISLGPRMMGNRGGQRGFAFNEQVIVISKEGKIVLDTLGSSQGENADNKLLNEAEPIIVNGETIGKIAIRVIPPRGVLSLEEQFITSVYRGFVWGGLAASLFAILLGIFFANSLVRPIQKLTEVVKDFAQGKWSKKAPIESMDEIGALANTFNQMADELDRSIKVKKQMVADVSHELRTPITILRGNLESIQAGVKKPTDQLILSMTDEVLRLSRLVGELQQLSLLDNNSLPINKKRVDLIALIQRVYEILLVEAQSKKINFKYHYIKEYLYLEADEDKIAQVIINLVTNALRHTPAEGQIMVRVEEDTEKDLAKIKIIDQGPGIPKEQLQNIFERFYRIDEARNREHGGMGLGLAISKGIIEAHGGQIKVESNQPTGSIFVIEIPL